MTTILEKQRIINIAQHLPISDLIGSQEEAFRAFSEGRSVLAPVGYLGFSHPPGDVHIKSGYLREGEHYVIKVASGFYKNPEIHLSSSNGLMLLFQQKTGILDAILLDEGYLTDLRTALAGAVAAKYLAPKKIRGIGMVGTGVQARLQLQYLQEVAECRQVFVWGRDQEKVYKYQQDMKKAGFIVEAVPDTETLLANCNLIVTTTPSDEPLLFAKDVQPGTHITAMGADAPGKQELDAELFRKADLVIADSRDQCADHGDLSSALVSGAISKDRVHELGEAVLGKVKRNSDDQITIADLTGLAMQDLCIAELIYAAAKE